MAIKMGREVQWGHGREGRPAHPCVGRAWFRPLVALVASPNVHGVPGGPMDHRWAGSWPIQSDQLDLKEEQARTYRITEYVIIGI